jgi:hypothetical protein
VPHSLSPSVSPATNAPVGDADLPPPHLPNTDPLPALPFRSDQEPDAGRTQAEDRRGDPDFKARAVLCRRGFGGGGRGAGAWEGGGTPL